MEKNGIWISIQYFNDIYSGYIFCTDMEGDIPIIYIRMILESNGITYYHEDYTERLFSFFSTIEIEENNCYLLINTIYEQDIGTENPRMQFMTSINLIKE